MALTKTAPTQAPAEREEPTRWMGKPIVLLLACLIVLTIFGFSFIQDPSRSAQTRDPAWYTWRVGLITDAYPGEIVREWGPFSMFSGGGPLVVIIAFVALGALLAFFFTHLHKRLVWLPTGLLIGGAAGNLIDRLRLGAVTDFIKLPHWPAFNVADICVTLGVISLIYVLEKDK